MYSERLPNSRILITHIAKTGTPLEQRLFLSLPFKIRNPQTHEQLRPLIVELIISKHKE